MSGNDQQVTVYTWWMWLETWVGKHSPLKVQQHSKATSLTQRKLDILVKKNSLTINSKFLQIEVQQKYWISIIQTHEYKKAVNRIIPRDIYYAHSLWRSSPSLSTFCGGEGQRECIYFLFQNSLLPFLPHTSKRCTTDVSEKQKPMALSIINLFMWLKRLGPLIICFHYDEGTGKGR